MSAPPMLARATLFALALAFPAKAFAYDTLVTGPLHEGRNGHVVGQLEGARTSTITFRDPTHAAVTFSTSAFEIRGTIDIAEGEARIRSTQHLVLSGSPFRIEVEPGTAVTLVDGLRSVVTLQSALPVDGLDVTTMRFTVASEETLPARDAALFEYCVPVYLWAEPRVHGPVIRTAMHGMFMAAPAPGAPGWSEVWVREHGVWLRGYTWEARHCGGGGGRIGGMGHVVQSGYRVTRVALPAEARIGSHEGAPWTVQVREPIEVELWESTGSSFYRFALSEGIARIEGVVLP